MEKQLTIFSAEDPVKNTKATTAKVHVLWNFSTTLRESSRVLGFLTVAKLVEGQIWNEKLQDYFQKLLIQKHQYLSDGNDTQISKGLNDLEIEYLNNHEQDIPMDVVEEIVRKKHYVDGPELRGRQSMAALAKLGLVYTQAGKPVIISDSGNRLLSGEISTEEVIFDSLLKLQYPNPLDTSYPFWNSKPFIAILHLISDVNKLCKEKGLKQKGITVDELGIFGLSLENYADIDKAADLVIKYRQAINGFDSYEEKEAYREEYINQYLKGFKKPVKNTREYADNVIRYFRQTRFIVIRGVFNNKCIDLEPRRMIEIESLLNSDNAAPRPFSNEEQWFSYYSKYGSYPLPYDTYDKLLSILSNVNDENKNLAQSTGKEFVPFSPSENKDELKAQIAKAREKRTELQNVLLKKEYFQTTKIDSAIAAFEAINTHDKKKILQYKPSIEMERWSNIALNILDDSVLIKPNASVGDDNEIIFTAPSGVPDIECYYQDFNMACEVTTLITREQWYSEGQPVMEHFRKFEEKHKELPNYCLFVAPRLHSGTMTEFWNSLKYCYKGQSQKIIPITIFQLEEMLNAVKKLHSEGKKLHHDQLKRLLDDCTNVDSILIEGIWLQRIDDIIKDWVNKVETV